MGWVAGLAWAYILTRMELTVAMPLYVGMTYALVCVAAVVGLGEAFTLKKAVALVLVLVGIVMLMRR